MPRTIAAAVILLLGLSLPGRAQDAPPPAPAAPAQPPIPQTSASPPGQAAADAPVGSVASVAGGASDFRNGAPVTRLKTSDAILKGDLLQTDADGSLAVTFDDETTFRLGPSATLAVSDFLFEQGGSKNSAVFNVVRGSAAFVASLVAKTGDMKIVTPTATLGIRGTTGLIEVPSGGTGDVSVKLYPDANGRVGQIRTLRCRRRAARNVDARGVWIFHPLRPGWFRRRTAAHIGTGSRARPRLRATDLCGATHGPAADQPASQSAAARLAAPAEPAAYPECAGPAGTTARAAGSTNSATGTARPNQPAGTAANGRTA